MLSGSANHRTCGDGMENATSTPVHTIEQTTANVSAAAAAINHHQQLPTKVPSSTAVANSNSLSTKIPGEHLIYRGASEPPRSLPAVVPQGRLFQLIPRLISKPAALGPNHSPIAAEAHRQRKPKFVPFEPYKAAISPMTLMARPPQATITQRHCSRNNLDVNTLVQHINSTTLNATASHPKAQSPDSDLERQRVHYERQLTELRRDRDSAAAQLKSQVLVNTELKHLLVAAVGEDLQTRVNVLTEDKLHLARALLSTAENLSSHTEQIEYLAGQSEVWRSKFLASSLMVEELARWKAALTAHNRQLATATEQLLQLVGTVRGMQLETLGNLQFVSRSEQQQLGHLPAATVLDVAAECVNISHGLVLHSEVGGMPREMDVSRLEGQTGVERAAREALLAEREGRTGGGGGATGAAPLLQADEAFRAVVGQAFPVNGKRNPSQPTETPPVGEDGRAEE